LDSRINGYAAEISYVSELVVSRPNSLSVTLPAETRPAINLSASCERERAEWVDALARAAKFNVSYSPTLTPVQ
jgi:hypothetical protein